MRPSSQRLSYSDYGGCMMRSLSLSFWSSESQKCLLAAQQHHFMYNGPIGLAPATALKHMFKLNCQKKTRFFSKSLTEAVTKNVQNFRKFLFWPRRLQIIFKQTKSIFLDFQPLFTVPPLHFFSSYYRPNLLYVY